VHALGDGALWIGAQVERCSGAQATYLVDFYHVSDYLGAAAKGGVACVERIGGQARRLAGEVEHHRRELNRLSDALSHVDATIPLFDPSCELGALPARQRGSRHQWFGPGACQRLVLEVLRDAVEPLSSRALAQEVAARKGLEDRRDVLAVVQKTASAVLRRLVAKGVARRQMLADGTPVWERV
jgi:hypothetical protein